MTMMGTRDVVSGPLQATLDFLGPKHEAAKNGEQMGLTNVSVAFKFELLR
jgi:hypothetical protein